MIELAPLLRIASNGAKALSSPARKESSDHEQFQRYSSYELAAILNDLEEPLRRLSTCGPHLDKEVTDELHAVATEIKHINNTMAAPGLWKSFFFWKKADGRSVLKQFSQNLNTAAACAQQAQPIFAQYEANKPYPVYNHDYAENTLQPLERDLADGFKAARESREVAYEFFSGWIRGKGFFKKQK